MCPLRDLAFFAAITGSALLSACYGSPSASQSGNDDGGLRGASSAAGGDGGGDSDGSTPTGGSSGGGGTPDAGGTSYPTKPDAATTTGGIADASTCGIDTYTNYAAAFLTTNCDYCHGHTFGSNYATFKSEDLLVEGYVGTGVMPQGATLSTADKNRLMAYINCGAPQ